MAVMQLDLEDRQIVLEVEKVPPAHGSRAIREDLKQQIEMVKKAHAPRLAKRPARKPFASQPAGGSASAAETGLVKDHSQFPDKDNNQQ